MFLSKEFDEKLIIAFDMYSKKMCESLPTDEELKDITFSETFEKKMQKLISAQKKSYFYLINTVGKRVAIIVLAIMISLTATTFGVKAIRETVIEFIIETYEKFTNIIVQNQDPNTQVELIKTAPQYVPESYVVESELDSGMIYKITYNNQEDIPINYNQKISFRTVFNINTEDVEYEKITINYLDGIKYVKNGINTIVFADETYMYTVYGQVSMEELIKMAESIKTE